MERAGQFALVGPNSSGKTELARTIALQNPEVSVISVGDLFRQVGTILQDLGIMPDQVDAPVIDYVLSHLEYSSIDGMVIFHNGRIHEDHTFLNGNTATAYAINPTVHEAVLKKVDSVADELSHTHLVGREGREPYGATFFITGDHRTVRRDIKLKECPDASFTPEEILIASIRKRDIADFRYNGFRIPERAYILKRKEGSLRETEALADFISRKLDTGVGNIEIPEGQQVFVYSSEKREVVYSHTLYRYSETHPRLPDERLY